MEYEFRTLDPHDESESNVAALTAWMNATSRGFHEGRLNDEHLKLWMETARTDDQRLAGAWLPEGEYGAGPMPVATFSSWDMTLNTGAGLIPLHMISDVTVSPAHRRQRLMSRLMLADLAATELPLAALTVSEASLYGRFGFGPATFTRRLEVDTTAKFALRDFTDPGRVEVVEPPESWETFAGVFEQFHESVRGSVQRPHFYQWWHTARYDFHENGPDRKLCGVVHLDADGTVDGYALWKHSEGEGDRPSTVTASMVAPSTTAQLALWRFLADIDLSSRVTLRGGPVEDVLDWSVTNRDVVNVKSSGNHTWLRILDAPTALSARPWYADGALVLSIDDPLGYAHGTFAIEASGGSATVSPTDADAEVHLSAETLASLFLGGVTVDTLARAGRVTGDVAALAAYMDGGPAPYSTTFF